MPEPRLDLTSDPDPANPSAGERPAVSRPFLGIRFKCCRTYGRIYRNDAGTKYTGHCPKCFAALSVPVGEGGTNTRFFNAG